MSEFLGLAAKVVGAAKVVDSATLGRGHQPRGGIGRHTGRRPLLERRHKRVLREVLRKLDITRHSSKGAHESGRLRPPRGSDRLGGCGFG